MTTESGDATVTANAAAAAAASATTAAAATEGKNTETQKKNRIQVSNTKKPLFFYVNLAKKYIQQHNEVELSALGMAITTVVTVSEILKNNGLATEKKVITSTVGMKDETRGRIVQKARIEIVLGKSEKFDSLVTNDTAPAKTPDPASGSTTAPAQAPATAKVQAATAPEQAAATEMVENKK